MDEDKIRMNPLLNKILTKLIINKMYIVVNNKEAKKGKLCRACVTVGMYNPTYKLSKVVVVKGGDKYNELREKYKDKMCGEHIDAGLTQVNTGTSLAFGLIDYDKDIERLSLM